MGYIGRKTVRASTAQSFDCQNYLIAIDNLALAEAAFRRVPLK